MTRTEGRLAGFRDGLRDLFAAPAASEGVLAGRPDSSELPVGGAARGLAETVSFGIGGEGLQALTAPGPEEIRKRRIDGQHRWYAGASVALVFLLVAMVQAATSGDSFGSIAVFEMLAVCFGAVYLFAPIRAAGGGAFAGAPGGMVGRVGALALMLALTVPMIALGGTGVTALWIYIAVVAAILFRLSIALGIALALAAAMMLVSGLAGDGLPWEMAFTMVALSLWMAGFVGNIRLTVELRTTREKLARAAVMAERARIGRDLHDILGHSLTAIAVKAALARRLAQQNGPESARITDEIADVERLAREVLADMRATAAGYRDVSLAGELAVARSMLAAAGIQADLPTAVDDVSPAGRDVFGYVVREAVTNVVRHSGARRCVIELHATSVEVSDDGAGGHSAPPGGAGSGLRGLAERLAAVGGRLSAGPRDGGGFRVRAELDEPAAGAAG